MNKRFGFTLAEVLITLGIIGVVAAMTIPTLIANTNSAKFRSQYKKTLSTLNQAGLMAQAQYDIDYGATVATCASKPNSKNENAQNPDSELTFCAILNGTLAGGSYTGAGGTEIKGKGDSAYSWVQVYTLGSLTDYETYSLADGSVVGFNKDAKGCSLNIGTPLTSGLLDSSSGSLKNCIGFIDVNGATLPNKEVACGTGSATITAPTRTPESPCTVGSDANHMTDIYPVVFHDATVEPATNAAKYVLTTSK
ncbi:type II secretion system protein [bacterium]|nr:type II secretion system protein [bacterium]